MRSFSLAALLLLVAGCDSADPIETALVGSWTETAHTYTEYVTAAEDIPFLSPYEPATGEIAVTGLDVPPIRYIVNDRERGTTCPASPCLGAVRFQSWPEGRQLPVERVSLELGETGPRLLLARDGTSSARSGADPVDATVEGSSITVPEIQFGQGAGAVTVGGRLEFTVGTLAGGVETAMGEPDRTPASGFGRLVFEPGGAYRKEYLNGSTTSRSEEGTWRLDGDRLTLSLTVPEATTREYEVRTSGDALDLAMSVQCEGNCRLGYFEEQLLLPHGSLASARSERVWSFRAAAP